MAGITMSPQLRESPDTANFQLPDCCEASGMTREIAKVANLKMWRRFVVILRPVLARPDHKGG
jgi:hypothetical protein